VTRINEVCNLIIQGQYIDVNELELTLATKSSSKRAASIDVNKQRLQKNGSNANMLPCIPGGEQALPSLGGAPLSLASSIPLPHSEPLSDEQKSKGASLIELFSLELVTCLYSQFWSNRQAALEKVTEQLHNLDPNRRDPMSAEINRKNLPIEEIFKIFINDFADESLKDPVLKNLITMIDLIKRALPTFFRYI